MPFFDILRLQGDNQCARAQKWCHFSYFPRAFKQNKKIKALRPKMTKIASRGSCLDFALSLGFVAGFLGTADVWFLMWGVDSSFKSFDCRAIFALSSLFSRSALAWVFTTSLTEPELLVFRYCFFKILYLAFHPVSLFWVALWPLTFACFFPPGWLDAGVFHLDLRFAWLADLLYFETLPFPFLRSDIVICLSTSSFWLWVLTAASS